MSRRKPSAGADEEAARFYQDFHWGREAQFVRSARLYVPQRGEQLVQLGTLEEVAYSTTKGREKAIWCHPFEPSRPVLAYSVIGKTLVIVGGSYRVTANGIEG